MTSLDVNVSDKPAVTHHVRVPFILGSSSPRRRDLLAQLDIVPATIMGADIDETPKNREKPSLYVQRIAREKAMALRGKGEFMPILAADTTVCVGRRILGKPADDVEARHFLELLSGRAHQVMTAVALALPDGRVIERMSTTRITMKRLHPTEIEAYIASDEWRGVAGAYRLQGWAEAFVSKMSGSYSGVVGLPLFETRQILLGTGIVGVGSYSHSTS